MGVSAAVVGGSVISGMMGASAATSAANTQAQASQQAAQLQAQTTAATNAQQLAMYNQNVARQQPFVETGAAANQALAQYMGTAPSTGGANYGQGAAQPTLADMTGAMNPMYEFQVQQGQQALQSSAAASGGLLTGQGLKDITNYGQQAAGAGLQQGYQNYVQNQNNLYNRLSGISNQGQAAAAGVGTMGTQVGSNIANTSMAGTAAQNQLMTSGANAQAAGMVGSANAITGSMNSGMNTLATLGGQGIGVFAPTTPGSAPYQGQAVAAGQPGATTSLPGFITPPPATTGTYQIG